MKRFFIPALAAAVFAPGAVFAQSTETPPDTVRQIQVELAARGYSPGPSDGRLNTQTIDALKRLQRSRAIEATGQINTSTLSALGLQRPSESSGTPPASMVGPGSTAPSATPQGATPQGTVLPGGIAQGVPLGGATPAGAPSPSFGATPAGAPSPSFGATPPGMQSPSSTVAGAPAPGATTTTTTTSPGSVSTTTTATPGAGNSAGARSGR